MNYQIPRRAPIVLCLVLSSCSGHRSQVHDPATASSASTDHESAIALPRLEPATGRLSLEAARRYMLELVNRDRRGEGLAPVVLDSGPAARAGQRHADDMARLGFLGHWGSDGSVPEQRHSEEGGADMVLENALCVVDERPRALDEAPTIAREEIERAESMFFNETPPNDGHRRNILGKWHTRVGIGIAQAAPRPGELPVPCFAQEFVDGYGTYAPLPSEAKVGAVVSVSGTLERGAQPTGVGVARVEAPRPLSVGALNARRSYAVPAPYQMYWGKGFVTPREVRIDGGRFAVDVPLDDRREPGLYEISVWAKMPRERDHTLVSLRTVRVSR